MKVAIVTSTITSACFIIAVILRSPPPWPLLAATERDQQKGAIGVQQWLPTTPSPSAVATIKESQKSVEPFVVATAEVCG